MTDCSCIYVGDYDEASFYEANMRKARKEHVCSECGRTIVPGEEYEYVFSVYDGDPRSYHTCLDCLSVRDAFFCEGYLHEGTWELVNQHIDEMMGDIPSSCLVSLTPKARERVCQLIENAWDRYFDDEDEDEH